MSEPEWIDLCALGDLEPGAPALRKAGGRRLACVRDGDGVHVVDDRCPHQGYPLSQGAVQGGVLTCAWHNWKFDLASGQCLFGGDAVRRLASRVAQGRVQIDVAVDREADAERARRGLREALFEADEERAVREGLRLGAARPGAGPMAGVAAAMREIAIDSAERAPYGFGHDLASLADLCSFVDDDRLAAAEALGFAAVSTGEMWQARPVRVRAEPAVIPCADASRALAEERRTDAEAAVRRAVREGGIGAAVDSLAPFVTSGLLGYGHGAIYAAKALELGERFPEAAEEIAATLAVRLGWHTVETSLPPFTATRRATAEATTMAAIDGEGAAFDRPALERAVLEGEKIAATTALDRLRQGVSPSAVILAAAHAAATRVLRFDRSWEDRVDAEAGILDVTHTLTFAESAYALTARPAYAVHAPRLAVIAAGFVGRLSRGDGPVADPVEGDSLLEALASRELRRARGAVRGLDRAGRADVFRRAVPFAVHEAFIRPIFAAHAVKMLEAARRLDAADRAVDDGAYLDAFLATVVPRTRERSVRRVATIATAFLGDGRPPEGLY